MEFEGASAVLVLLCMRSELLSIHDFSGIVEMDDGNGILVEMDLSVCDVPVCLGKGNRT